VSGKRETVFLAFPIPIEPVLHDSGRLVCRPAGGPTPLTGRPCTRLSVPGRRKPRQGEIGTRRRRSIAASEQRRLGGGVSHPRPRPSEDPPRSPDRPLAVRLERLSL